MIEDKKIIEQARERLSFVEQLQNQIQLCREALSDKQIPLTPKVETLEALLWAKLKDDEKYNKSMTEINENYKAIRKKLKEKLEYWKVNKTLIPHIRQKAREQFKAIMVFIDKKNLMPIEENE